MRPLANNVNRITIPDLSLRSSRDVISEIIPLRFIVRTRLFSHSVLVRWSLRHMPLFDKARIGVLIESIKLQPLVMRELHEGLRRKSTLRLRKGFGGGSFALL